MKTESLAKFGAYTAIVLGTFGMVFCLRYLFSAKQHDLIGAGFPFIGGAIIASAGLIFYQGINQLKNPRRAFIHVDNGINLVNR